MTGISDALCGFANAASNISAVTLAPTICDALASIANPTTANIFSTFDREVSFALPPGDRR